MGFSDQRYNVGPRYHLNLFSVTGVAAAGNSFHLSLFCYTCIKSSALPAEGLKTIQLNVPHGGYWTISQPTMLNRTTVSSNYVALMYHNSAAN